MVIEAIFTMHTLRGEHEFRFFSFIDRAVFVLGMALVQLHAGQVQAMRNHAAAGMRMGERGDALQQRKAKQQQQVQDLFHAHWVDCCFG